MYHQRSDGHLRLRIITGGVLQGSILGPILFLLDIIYLQNLVPVTTLETIYKDLVEPVEHLRQVIER